MVVILVPAEMILKHVNMTVGIRNLVIIPRRRKNNEQRRVYTTISFDVLVVSSRTLYKRSSDSPRQKEREQ